MRNNQSPATPSPVPPSRAPSGAPPLVRKGSPLGRFFRGLLRWVTAIAVVFGLGVLATWFVRVQPQSEQLAHLQTRVVALETQINGPQPQVEILQCLLDISKAQVALAQGNQDGMRQALSATDARLAKLEQELPPEQGQTLHDARSRLTMVLSEAGSSALAARNDLEVLSNDLASLRPADSRP